MNEKKNNIKLAYLSVGELLPCADWRQRNQSDKSFLVWKNFPDCYIHIYDSKRQRE